MLLTLLACGEPSPDDTAPEGRDTSEPEVWPALSFEQSPDATVTGEGNFGAAVLLSEQGIAVGSPHDADYAGSVTLFDHQLNPIGTLEAPEPEMGFGRSLVRHGNRLAVGGYDYELGSPNVWVYNWSGDLLRTLVTSAEGDNFGSVMASADLNDDGDLDLIIAAPTDSSRDQGSVWLVHGPLEEGIVYDEGRFYGYRTDGELGTALAVADLNADGLPEVVASEPFPDDPTGPGTVWVHPDVASGFASPVDVNAEHTLSVDGATHFGLHVATGDVNDDGYIDLSVASQDRVYVFALLDSGPTATLHAQVASLTCADVDARGACALVAGTADGVLFYSGPRGSAEPDLILEGPGDFGATLTAGPADADGASDLLLGGPDQARVWLFLGG